MLYDDIPSSIQDWSSEESESESTEDFGKTRRYSQSRSRSRTSFAKPRRTSPDPYDEEEEAVPSRQSTPTRPLGRRFPSIFGVPRRNNSTSTGATARQKLPAEDPPFEEAGPTARVWQAYVDESLIHDAEMVANERDKVNILLVFAGLFSAIVSAFIAQSSSNLQPDYDKLSAYLLFDLVNIQRALANGTSLDGINTSGTDPTVLANEWHYHYLSPISGDPQIRSRIRQFRYMGLRRWHVSGFIALLPLMLHLSLGLFLLGLVLYLLPLQLGIALSTGTIAMSTFVVYVTTNTLPMIYPQCPYKTPVSSVLYAIFIRMLGQFPAILNAISSSLSPHHHTLRVVEQHAAETSRAEFDVQALYWLYAVSSNSFMRRLVIQALAGLPADCSEFANRLFQPHWREIRDEKEEMLMDCMEKVLNGDGSSTRWIPKNIPDIDRRVEQLLRLEIQFPPLRREPQFGGYDLDLSNKFIYFEGLSTTLSSLEATHIRKPIHLPSQKQVAMNALAHNVVHHPVVWKSLFPRAVEQGLFSRASDTVLNVDMCFNLVASLFLTERASPASYSTTLADTAIECFPDEVLDNLLSFFENFDLYQESMDRRPRLLLAIMRLLVLNSEHSELNLIDLHSSQRRFFHSDSTISKYRLLIVALYAISRRLHDPDNPPLPLCHRGVFEAILSYITSDLFIGTSTRSQNDSEYGTLVWTCRAHALASIAWFIEHASDFGVIVPIAEWATRPLFSNLLRVMAQSDDYYHYNTQRLPYQRFGSLFGVISFLLGRGLSGGISHGYETFRQERSLEYIAQRNSLHIWFIEALEGYITLLSEATDESGTENHTAIDSEALRSHIEDLHQVPVILSICMSIALNGVSPRPILCSLASIAPDRPEWNTLPDVVAWHIDDDAFLESYYSDSREVIPPGDAKRLKKNLKEVLDVLTDCVETAKDRTSSDSGINWPLIKAYTRPGSLETHHGSRWRRWKKMLLGSRSLESDTTKKDIEQG
ncbi:hypothetical protein EDD18DRAFT_1113163 [Armillaria luteobubalina]|uniref:DUF6535 domain-containing protein n=1 Tax=Armillaria luteobubalina TaxID=153913 RepID=A0AA39PB89_9AGAR|nr:hypothetical protein EDD18DRAFT_1113163 [Armillaria luteobubalina]